MDIKAIYDKLESTMSNEQISFIDQINKNKKQILIMYKAADLKNNNYDTYKEDKIKKNNLFINQVKTIIDTDIDMKSEKIEIENPILAGELSISFKHDIFNVRIMLQNSERSEVSFCLNTDINETMYTSAFSYMELPSGMIVNHVIIEQKKSNVILRDRFNLVKKMDSDNRMIPLLPIIELINSDIYDKNNIEDLCELYFDKKINLKQISPENIHISQFMKIKEFIENNDLALRKTLKI